MTTKTASAPKRFFVRGVADALQRKGVTKFASHDAMRQAADYVAVAVDFPEPLVQQGDNLFLNPHFDKVANRVAAACSNQLIEVQKNFDRQGIKQASYGAQAVINTLPELGQDIMRGVKLAMESAVGASVESGNPAQQNGLPLSVQTEAEQDLARRPLDYAVGDMGVSVPMLPQAARLGIDAPHPLRESGVQNNGTSKIELANVSGGGREVTAAIQASLRKMAMDTGASVDSGNSSQSNMISDSVQTEAQQDAARRPAGYAVGDMGIGVPNLPDAARLGTDMAHPEREGGTTGAFSNAIQAGNNANATKAAQVDNLVAQLPNELSVGQKVAAANEIISLPPELRPAYVNELFRRLGA